MKSTRIPVTEESLQNGTAELKQFTDTTSFVGEPGAKPTVNMAENQPRDEQGRWTDEDGVVDIGKQADYIRKHFAGKMKKYGWKDEGDGRATKRFARIEEPGTIVADGGRILTATIERGMPVIKMGDEFVVGAFQIPQGQDSQTQADYLNTAAEKYVASRRALFK